MGRRQSQKCFSLLFFQEIQAIKTVDEVEAFMLKHGENIVDSLGAEVDRIEKTLKVKFFGSLHYFLFFLHELFILLDLFSLLGLLCLAIFLFHIFVFLLFYLHLHLLSSLYVLYFSIHLKFVQIYHIQSIDNLL